MKSYIQEGPCPRNASASPTERVERWKVYGLGGGWSGLAAGEEDALRQAGDAGVLMVSWARREAADHPVEVGPGRSA